MSANLRPSHASSVDFADILMLLTKLFDESVARQLAEKWNETRGKLIQGFTKGKRVDISLSAEDLLRVADACCYTDLKHTCLVGRSNSVKKPSVRMNA
jgi:hypothetical protein